MKRQAAGDLLAALFGDERACAAFDALPPSHRREYVHWIEEAKSDKTRARRIGQTLERLRRNDR